MNDIHLLTKREVADALHLSIYTIDAWVSKRKHLPYVKFGRKVLFKESDVLEYIRRQTVTPKSGIEAA